MQEFEIAFPSRKDIKDLKKRGLFSLGAVKITDYAIEKSNHTKGDSAVCTSDYNNESMLIYFINYIDSFLESSKIQTKFKRVKMKNSYIVWIFPLIKLTSDELNHFLEISYEKNGKKVVKFGNYEYELITGSEREELDEECAKGNIIFIDLLDKDYDNVERCEYYYKGKKYIREVDYDDASGLDIVNWYLVRDLEWYIDEKGKQLVSTSIIDCLQGNNPSHYLERLAVMFGRQRDKNNEEKLLLTPNEEKECLPFFVPDSQNNHLVKFVKSLDVKNIASDFVYALGKKEYDKSSSIFDDSLKYQMIIRPCIEYNLIKDKCKLSNPCIPNLMEYGEYPQDYVISSEAEVLEKYFLLHWLRKTHKVYTSYHLSKKEGLVIEEHEEYEYKGSKYIRLDSTYRKNYSNKSSYSDTVPSIKKPLWIKVKPIKWLVDEEKKYAVCAVPPLFFSNIDPLDKEKLKPIGIKEINNYLRKYFSKEIQTDKTKYNIQYQEKISDDNIMSQIISRKKAKLAQVQELIEKNESLKKIMEDNNLTISDIEIDEEGNAFVKGLRIRCE